MAGPAVHMHAAAQALGALVLAAQAAAKVEALSSNGMDEIEIPAFLRKQAD